MIRSPRAALLSTEGGWSPWHWTMSHLLPTSLATRSRPHTCASRHWLPYLAVLAACGGVSEGSETSGMQTDGSDSATSDPGTTGGADSTGDSNDVSDDGEASTDDTGTGGGAEEFGPVFLLARISGSTDLPLQVADVTEVGVAPEFHPLLESATANISASASVVTNTWSAYRYRPPGSGVTFDDQVLVHDFVNQPLGPLIEVEGLPLALFYFAMDAERSVLALRADDGENQQGYLVSLDTDPSTAVPLQGAETLDSVYPSPDGQWVWGFGGDRSDRRHVYVAPITDGEADPLTAIVDLDDEFPAAEWVPRAAVFDDSALYHSGLRNSGLYRADISDWPRTEITELHPPHPDPETTSIWRFAADGSQAIRLQSDINSLDRDGLLVTIDNGVAQPPVDIDLPPRRIHDLKITPDGAYAFFTTGNPQSNDDVRVSWLDGPDPQTAVAISTVPFGFGFGSLVLVDGYAVWMAGAGGLQASTIEADGIGAPEQLSPDSEAVSQLWVVGDYVAYLVADPNGGHIAEPLWMIDMSGDEPGPPMSVTHPLPDGTFARDTAFLSPSGDQFFYATSESTGPGPSDTPVTVWSRPTDNPRTANALIQAESLSFAIVTPPVGRR